MKRQNRHVDQTIVSYDPTTGTSSITFKDKELFPDGFLLTLNPETGPSNKIRDIFVSSNHPDAEWLEDADRLYGAITRAWGVMRRADPTTPMALKRASNRIQPNLLLGRGISEEFLMHQTFKDEKHEELSPGEDSERNIRPDSVLIHGTEGSGKTTMLEFLHKQAIQSSDYVDVAFFGVRNGHSAWMRTAGSSQVNPVEAVDLMEYLHTTNRHTVVFVESHKDLGPRSHVVASTLNSLVYSGMNPYLSFVVTREKINPTERRFYSKSIETRPKGSGVGVYSLTSRNPDGMQNLIFRTPSHKHMAGVEFSAV